MFVRELHVRCTLSDMGLSVWNAEHVDSVCDTPAVAALTMLRPCEDADAHVVWSPTWGVYVQVVTAFPSAPAAPRL